MVPVTDEYGLLRPKAFVVLKNESINDFDALCYDLKNYAKQHVGSHQYPHLFERIDSLPRTASGKLQRARLLTETSEQVKEKERLVSDSGMAEVINEVSAS